MRRKKLIVILLAIMLGIPIATFAEFHTATAVQHYLPEINQEINLSYVHNITERLSKVIYQYQPGELAKGRAFGSDGERYAAENILAIEMEKIGLYNLSLNPPYLERIKNYTYTLHLDKNQKHYRTEELEVTARSMKLINISTNPPNITTVDCYISPRWSLEGFLNGSIPENKSRLTGNFNYTNLKIHRTPSEIKRSVYDFTNASMVDIFTHVGNLTDYDAIANYSLTKFQNYYNFSFDNLTEHPENAKNKSFYNATFFNQSQSDPYVFIDEDIWNNPNHTRNPCIHRRVPKLNKILRYHGFPGNLDENRATISQILDGVFFFENLFKMRLMRCLPNCEGEIRYDYTNNSHDMVLNQLVWLPVLYINGTVGKNIIDDRTNYRVDFNLSQRWNASEISYNVIGQINGTDPSKIIMINSLYDCWWNQGSADSATGCGLVLALARKYQDLNRSGIRPKNTLKFVLFGGEESGMAGAYSYAIDHPQNSEHIETFIDLNQLGFTQPYPRLTMDVGTNRLLKKSLFKQMGEDTNYVERTKNTTNFSVYWTPSGMISDDSAFTNRWWSGLTTITFPKDTAWFRHHRDGMNHTEGDSMKYYNSTDVAACASLIYNCTKYYCINPNCSFHGQFTNTTKDSPDDSDNLVDTVESNMPLQSILSSDLVRVKAVLTKHVLFWYLPVATAEKDYIIDTSVSHHTIDVTLPPYLDKGNYSLTLYLYNSTGRLNYIVHPIMNDSPNDTSSYYGVILNPRGNEHPTTPSQPSGPSTLQVGERGTWTSVTSDPNHDLVGEQWYSKKSTKILYEKFKDTGLYDPTTTTPPVSRIFWSAGTYDIRVKAYDQYSGLLHPYESLYSTIKEVSVTPRSNIFNPQQQLHQDQGNVLHLVQGEPICLYGSQTGSSSPQYQWDFKDGSEAASEQNTTHCYTTSGIYNLTLNVTDTQTQLKGSNTLRVRVTPLDSNFNMTYFHGTTPNTPISFRNVSKAKSGKHITNCTWNFGDGTVSYQSNVNHTFTKDGDYNVTLTVKDNQSNIDTDYTIIDITNDPFPPEIPEVQSPGIITNMSDATILALVDPTDRNLSSVKVQITTPNNTTGNYTMTHLGDDIYLFTLNNSSMVGQYNFTVWAKDTKNNTNSSSGSYYLMLPVLTYVSPTPNDGANVNHSWVKINVSVNDTCNTSAFIDWNRTLKGYWPMDTYNSTCIYDNSTYENYGLFHNGINASNITTGKYGKGLEFDGNDDYVDLGNDTSLNLGSGNFTFMVWEKSHAASYANTTVILSNQPENANWSGYVFGVKNTPFLYTINNGQSTLLNGSHDVTDNAWHHIAYVRKGNNLSLYVDRVFDAGRTGTLRNITNNKDTCFSYENRTDWYHFDGVLDEAQLFGRALSREEVNASYNNGLYRLYHNFTGLTEGTYSYYAHAIDTTGNMSETEVRTVSIDFDPQITAVSASPHTVGFGFNVTISANVTDSGTGVNTVNVNITYPDHTHGNYTMSHTTGITYQYVFSSTWQTGQYNYTIWATDHSNNSNSSTEHHFHVSATATISIATLKDSYGKGEYINLTDPPASPENLSLVGRGLTWNAYYNASSGDNVLEAYQGPVNYQEDNGTWTPINCSLGQLATDHPAYSYGYRAGNDRGLYSVYFKPNLQNSWPVAFAYNRSADPTTHIVRSKLVGVGYLDPSMNWSYKYLQNVQSSQGQFSDNTATYENVFTGTDVTWSYGNIGLKEEITLSNATKSVLQNHPPSSYGLHNASSYLVFITKLDHQNLDMYNASGMLTGNVTISDVGVDFKDALGQFKCALPLGEAYELNNESARQKLTYRIVHLNGNTYLLSGLKAGTLTNMTFPVVIDPTLTVNASTSDGYLYKPGSNYSDVWSASDGVVSSDDEYISIGQGKVNNIPPEYHIFRGFLLFDTSELPANVCITNAILSLYKKDDYSATDFTITVQNGQPVYPNDPLEEGDYDKEHYSGNGGGLNTVNFVNGRNNITLTDLSWVNAGDVTKLCLRSSRDINGNIPTGNEYVTVYTTEQGDGYQPKLVIIYSNQSKIKNTGSTDVKGYLLIQVQFFDDSQYPGDWIVDHDTVNESMPRTINASEQLGLDTIFNGLVKTDDLTHGSDTYRVYAAFRDPEGNILKTSDEVELAAWYEFEVNL